MKVGEKFVEGFFKIAQQIVPHLLICEKPPGELYRSPHVSGRVMGRPGGKLIGFTKMLQF